MWRSDTIIASDENFDVFFKNFIFFAFFPDALIVINKNIIQTVNVDEVQNTKTNNNNFDRHIHARYHIIRTHLKQILILDHQQPLFHH